MQSEKNDGRGVDCVKTLIYYLRNNDWQRACAAANNEWDKISSYKDIADFVIDIGLCTPMGDESIRALEEDDHATFELMG